MPTKPLKSKRFIVKKYVMASSLADCIKKEKKTAPDFVLLDEDYKEEVVVGDMVITGFTNK